MSALVHGVVKERESFTTCAGKTGGMVWAEMPYAEGLATHSGSESCV